MRIAVIANTAWYLSNFRLNLMRALSEAGHEIVAVAPSDQYVQRIRDAGFRFIPVPISGSGTNPLVEAGVILRLWRLFRREKIDLVLCYTPKGNIYSALAAIPSGIPFIPNISGLGRSFIRRSALTHVVQALYRLTLKRAVRVFFQNGDDLATFIAHGLVTPNDSERLPGSGVDLARFVPTSGGHDNAPIFLLVARMLWDKGVGEFVEAAQTVRARYPGTRFLLLGFVDVANPSAISRQQVQTWVDSGLIEYLGSTDDVRPFMQEADCVVLPSYREGLPRTLLEAAAMARPVITTDVPGCRDTLIDGQTGFLCKVRDGRDLAETMLRFLALPAERRGEMGKAGRAYVEANFGEQRVLQRYLDLVASIDHDRRATKRGNG